MKIQTLLTFIIGSILLSGNLFAQNEYCQDFKTSCFNPNLQNPFFEKDYLFNPIADVSEERISIVDGWNGLKASTWIPITFNDCFQEGEIVSNINIQINLISSVLDEIEVFLHLPNHLVDQGFQQVLQIDGLNSLQNENSYQADEDHNYSELGKLIEGGSLKASELKTDYSESFYSETNSPFKPSSYGSVFFLEFSNHHFIEGPGWPTTDCVELLVGLTTTFPRPNENSPLIESVEHVEDLLVEGNCTNGEWENSNIIRTWRITDLEGEISTCNQTITLDIPSFKELAYDSRVDYDCTNALPNEDLQHPFSDLLLSCTNIEDLKNAPCHTSITFEEIIIQDECGHKKSIREWSFFNWCSNDMFYRTQVLEQRDEEGPEIEERLYVELDAETCAPPTLTISDFEIFDHCTEVVSANFYIRSLIQSDTFLKYNLMEGVEQFPYIIGQNKIIIEASDVCGNTSEKEGWLYILDETDPLISSQEISLEIDTETCESSSFDLSLVEILDCREMERVLLKMEDPLSSGETIFFNLSEGQVPTFSVGETVVEIIATDESYNQSNQDIVINVIDNAHPIIPKELRVEVSENNCSLPELDIENYQIFDLCSDLKSVIASVLVSSNPEVYEEIDLLNNEELPQLKLGTHTIEITAIDIFENQSIQELKLLIEDNTPAEAICQQFSFRLKHNSSYTLNASEIDGGSRDNCAEIEKFEMRNISGANPSEWSETYEFSISDVGLHHFELRPVFDNGQNPICNTTIRVHPPKKISNTELDTIQDPNRPLENVKNGIDLQFKNTEVELELSNVFPNPFSSTLNLGMYSNKGKKVEITIYDLLGKKVYVTHRVLEKGENHINLILQQQLANGTYFLKINDGQQQVNRKIQSISME